MSSPTVVDSLGMLAGAVWLGGAIYFQMIRDRQVHPAYVATLTLIGVALMLSSSALALRGTRTIEVLAMIGNLLFLLVGLGVIWGIQSGVVDDSTQY